SCVSVAFAFRRTARGARTLRALRVRYADLGRAVDTATDLTPQDAGMAVALFGDAALVMVMPAAAHDSGLLGGSRWSTSEPQPSNTSIQSP
ncbi:hypothetical protein, partial [Micromonospora sp. NPDC051296]|uniref:hypothetical protein n=1 Tax=Micromonospora sp. NPDC051296 TaxID=3155046 RepID=UPI00343AEE15